MKHKWKSKLSETGSVFKINHHSNFAKSVLEPSLIDFSFDEYEFFIGTHRVPIKMPITVMSLPVVLLKHIVSNKCKGDNLVKAAQHVLVAQVSLLVKNELQDTKLLAASDTFHKRYQEEFAMDHILVSILLLFSQLVHLWMSSSQFTGFLLGALALDRIVDFNLSISDLHLIFILSSTSVDSARRCRREIVPDEKLLQQGRITAASCRIEDSL
ncbi:hypothetical protein HID58_082122 [Brassica napus]|uniref:Uncharacterized protein n=1 Tax=Brassica napus TaxID=3708 RepID=A0ABQ7YCF3_BRANA|nr:hypothetical protein HID58_082122 [Brassica napus]